MKAVAAALTHPKPAARSAWFRDGAWIVAALLLLLAWELSGLDLPLSRL